MELKNWNRLDLIDHFRVLQEVILAECARDPGIFESQMGAVHTLAMDLKPETMTNDRRPLILLAISALEDLIANTGMNPRIELISYEQVEC